MYNIFSRRKKKPKPSKTGISAVSLSRPTDLTMNLPRRREESKKVFKTKWMTGGNCITR